MTLASLLYCVKLGTFVSMIRPLASPSAPRSTVAKPGNMLAAAAKIGLLVPGALKIASNENSGE